MAPSDPSADLSFMVSSLVRAAKTLAGLEVGLAKCTWVQVHRREQLEAEAPADAENRRPMTCAVDRNAAGIGGAVHG